MRSFIHSHMHSFIHSLLNIQVQIHSFKFGPMEFVQYLTARRSSVDENWWMGGDRGRNGVDLSSSRCQEELGCRPGGKSHYPLRAAQKLGDVARVEEVVLIGAEASVAILIRE